MGYNLTLLYSFSRVFPVIVNNLVCLEVLVLKVDKRSMTNNSDNPASTDIVWGQEQHHLVELSVLDLGAHYSILESFILQACPALSRFYCSFATPKTVDSLSQLPIQDDLFGPGTRLATMVYFYRTVQSVVVRSQALDSGYVMDDLHVAAYHENLRGVSMGDSRFEVGLCCYMYGEGRVKSVLSVPEMVAVDIL